jgi:hypothetical protein
MPRPAAESPALCRYLEREQSSKIMSEESFPPANMSRFVRRVPNEEASDNRRDWTGNDENSRNHHGKIPLSESPLRLRLSWKKSPKDSARLVGIFDFDLRRLLEAGYIRLEPKSENELRLRFYHGWDNVISIQVNLKEPGLPIGRLP